MWVFIDIILNKVNFVKLILVDNELKKVIFFISKKKVIYVKNLLIQSSKI